jgi:hypothetical protein
MNDRIAQRCVCCDSIDLKKSPAILLPFITHRLWGYASLEITDEWGLEKYGIRNGPTYTRCNSLLCTECFHLFLDLRFDDNELQNLYKKYREKEYTELREMYEPGYTQRNSKYLLGYNYLQHVETFLKPWLKTDQISNILDILDWGGGPGNNTPFYSQCRSLHIYDISDNFVLPKVKKVNKTQLYDFDYGLIICSNVLEHTPYPKNTLNEIKACMGKDSILYIELPYEDYVRKTLEKNNLSNLHINKRHWHEHISFFNPTSLRKLVCSSGLELLDVRKLKISGQISTYIFQVVCKLAI